LKTSEERQETRKARTAAPLGVADSGGNTASLQSDKMWFKKVIYILLLACCYAQEKDSKEKKPMGYQGVIPPHTQDQEKVYPLLYPYNPDGSLDRGLAIKSQSFIEAMETKDEDVKVVEEPDGKRCIDKIEMVEDIEYDDEIQCDYVDEKECRTTFNTNYRSEQEEECEDTFKKNCKIEQEHTVKTITFCSTTLVKDCEGEECGFSEGEEECFDKTQSVVQKAPKMKCSLEPAVTCKNVTKLIPKLGPTEECVMVSKKVCKEKKVNRRIVKKPVARKWCYVPNELDQGDK